MKYSAIRLRRINAGYEKVTDDLLEKLGIGSSAFYKLEQGVTKRPSAKLIARLAKVYGCTTDEIFKDLKITG